MTAPEWNRMSWFKSTRSAGNGACVEVAFADTTVGVRDSKDPQGPVLEFEAEAWSAFVRLVGSGQFDL
jgi:hypothetical protein